MRFKNPQKPRGLLGHGTKLADRFLPVRINGDMALFAGREQGAARARGRARRARCSTTTFIDAAHATASTTPRRRWRALDWATIEERAGCRAQQIEAVADDVIARRAA